MEKQRCEESERRREEEGRSEKRERVRRKSAGARGGRKVTVHCVFRGGCGSGGSKTRLAKAACVEPSGQMRDEELHAVVARSTFASEKAKNTSRPDTCAVGMWKKRIPLRCEAHVQVKMQKTRQCRTTDGS